MLAITMLNIELSSSQNELLFWFQIMVHIITFILLCPNVSEISLGWTDDIYCHLSTPEQPLIQSQEVLRYCTFHDIFMIIATIQLISYMPIMEHTMYIILIMLEENMPYNYITKIISLKKINLSIVPKTCTWILTKIQVVKIQVALPILPIDHNFNSHIVIKHLLIKSHVTMIWYIITSLYIHVNPWNVFMAWRWTMKGPFFYLTIYFLFHDNTMFTFLIKSILNP